MKQLTAKPFVEQCKHALPFRKAFSHPLGFKLTEDSRNLWARADSARDDLTTLQRKARNFPAGKRRGLDSGQQQSVHRFVSPDTISEGSRITRKPVPIRRGYQ